MDKNKLMKLAKFLLPTVVIIVFIIVGLFVPRESNTYEHDNFNYKYEREGDYYEVDVKQNQKSYNLIIPRDQVEIILTNDLRENYMRPQLNLKIDVMLLTGQEKVNGTLTFYIGIR